MTIETKTTKSGNITVKVDGERASIKTAARVLNNAMIANNNETVEIVNEAGEKFTYGGTEYKQSYTHYHFNNDNGKSFEIRDYVRSYNEIAEEAIRTIAKMPEIEKVQAEYAASWERIKKAANDKAETEPAEVNTEIQEETKMTNQTQNAVSTPATTNAEFVIDTKVTADGKVTVALNGQKMSLKKAIANLLDADAQIVKIHNEQGETLNFLFNDPFSLNRETLYFYWNFKTDFVDKMARGELDPKTGEPKSLTATTNTVEIDDEATETAATVETENTEVTDNKEETKMTNQIQNAVSTPATEIQAGTISINAHAVGNGRVVVNVYGNHECAPANLDDIAAEMPRLSDINIIAHDHRNFIAKGASYNGRFYAKANVYIFTNTSHGTDGFKKMYKFDTAKEAVRKLARQELDNKIITAEELEILLAADREIERQHQAKLNAECEARDAEWAKYEHARHFAEKIAADSKSVDNNFRLCICSSLQKPVQTALADSDDDNTDVFDMIPDTDELNDVDTDDDTDEAEADEPQGYIFSKTLVSSGYSAHNNAHYSKLERIDKECKILGNSEQTNGSIYREVAFYNADHAHSWAVKTADGKVIISGKGKPDFDKIVAAVNNAEAKAADNISDINEPCHETATVDEPAAIAKFKVGHFYKGDQKYGNKTLEIKIRVTGRTNKTIFYVTRDDQDYEFKSKIKLDAKTEFISDTGGRFAKAADEVPEPVNNGDTPSPENKEDTSMTNTKPTATTDEIREACMEAQTQLETKIATGAPESEVKAVAEQIADFNRQYAQAYEVECGRKLKPDCINDDADKIIADTIELLTVVDKDGNEIKPTTPLTSAEMNAAIDRLVAEFDREQAEAQKPISLADLKAKYDASEDEAERVAIAINAYRKFLEPEKIKQERQISEQVCASLTADAPQGWAVTFTDKGNYKVTAHGLSAATLDTITAGDFINPKAFFAKFNRTQADIDNERETAIAELKNQREQLQNMRAELVADFPDEKERLKILDDMIAETDQDIAVFENLAWKPGMFDDKHFNEDKLPF